MQSDTVTQERVEHAALISFRAPKACESVLERVRVKRGAKSRTKLIIEAILSHHSAHLTKSERAKVGKYIKEAA